MATVRALGVDVGSTNTKVALVHVDAPAAGGPHGAAALGPALADVHPGADEPRHAPVVRSARTPARAEALVDVVVRLVREVLAAGDGPPDVIGIASMAETGVPLGADGAPLTELLRWDGHRAADEAAGLAAAHGRLALFAATGVRPSAKVPLATLAWLRDHHPDVHRAMAAWAGTADLLALAFAGALVTDHTLAGRTMAYRLPEPGTPQPLAFDDGLLGLVGLGAHRLPRVAAPTDVVGRTDGGSGREGALATLPPGRPGGAFWAPAARALEDAGVRRGTPVVVAGHDHAVGSWAVGVRRPGDRADSLGTAEAIMTVVARRPVPRTVADAGMSLVRTVSGSHDAVLAGTSSAGAMLGWLGDRLRELPSDPTADEHTAAGRPTRDDPAASHVARALDRAGAAVRADPAPSGVLVLPYLSGRQTPVPDATLRVVVAPPTEDPVLLTRAVLEGVAFQARWMLREQARIALDADPTTQPGTVTVLGGPADHATWAAVKRLVTPDPLRWSAVAEPVAVGAALLGAVRAGLLGDVATLLGAAPTLPTSPSAPTPRADPRVADAHDAAFAAFVRLALDPGEARARS